MNTEFFLHSARLQFRLWTENDLAFAVALWGDQLVTAFIGGPFTEDQIARRLCQEIENNTIHGIQYWPIFTRENERFIGCCGLRLYGNDDGSLELGFHICSADWDKGYATEAAGCVIDHAMTVLHVNWLVAGHHPENKSSKHVLLKLGFIYIGDDFYTPTGLYHPTYELTPEKYQIL